MLELKDEELFTEDLDTLYDQLETIRVSGCVNMMKHLDVQQIAKEQGFQELVNTIYLGEYHYLLESYNILASL